MKQQSEYEFVFLPLGGSGEIGMNLNAYGYGPADDRTWIIMDIGVTFGDAATPGIDVIMPDPSFLEGENVIGIVLTGILRRIQRRVLHWMPQDPTQQRTINV